MNISLAGKRALVCGASRGIGRAAAEALAAQGAQVILVARDAKALEAVRAGLAGDGHTAVSADLGDPVPAVLVLAEHLVTAGTVQILVNNTGGPKGGPIHAAATDEFEDAFRQHLVANQLLVKAVLPGMRAAGYGRVINVISTSVKEPIPGLGVSNTIRGAVASWAKTLAGELGVHGITVNNVLPGFTRTERLAALFEARASERGVPLEAVEDEARARIPLGRFAEPAEIAAAIAFLASPAAAYINGINLPVDGGRTGSL